MNFFQDAIVLEKHQERIDKGEMVFTGCFDEEKLVGVIVMGNFSNVDLFFVDGRIMDKGLDEDCLTWQKRMLSRRG